MIKYKKLKNLLIWSCKQKKVGSQLPTATRMAELEEGEPVPLILLPCSSCNRTFRPEALAKHAKVCEKTLMKKRKQFDSAKQRLQGTDVPNFPSPTRSPKEPKSRESIDKTAPKSKWREKQADLASALSGSKKKKDNSSAPVKPSDHEQCPYCERYFGPKAYDRHTEWCKEQQIKLKNISANTNHEARERLQVRTKYRAPLTNRVLTRDKYLPRSRDPSPTAYPKTETATPSKFSSALNRSSSLRMSGRSKTVVVKSSRTPLPSRRNNSKDRTGTQNFLNDLDNAKTKLRMPDTITSPPKIITAVQSRNKKEDGKYDPFASAEQQMLELFGSSPIINAIEENNANNSVSPNSEVPSKTLPLSAFAIYTPLSRSNKASSSESLKLDNQEINNNSNVDSDETMSPPNGKVDDYRRNFSLSNLSLCSIISLDSVDCNRNPLGGTSGRNKNKDDSQRSCSAIETKSGRHRGKIDMQQMLYGTHSPDPTSPSNVNSNEIENLEACEAELLVSMLEFEKMLNSSPIPSMKPYSKSNSPSPKQTETVFAKEPDDEFISKTQQTPNSADSAYSSLTRAAGEGDVIKNEPSRFCHECGSKYPVLMAKFCCNCGIRRIAM